MEKFVMIQMTAAQIECLKKLASAAEYEFHNLVDDLESRPKSMIVSYVFDTMERERAMLNKSITQFNDGLARLKPPEDAEGSTYPT